VEYIYIRNGRRFDINADHEIDGEKFGFNSFLNKDIQSRFNIVKVPVQTTPEDYSEETYYRTEQDDAPYVIYTKKSDEQIQQVWWNKVKQQRDELTENGGCLHSGYWFHTDTKSKQQQMALAMLGQDLPAGIQWKTMDGSFVEMTPALAQSLFVAQVGREQLLFFIAEQVKNTPFVDVAWPERFAP
jgi:hypothetical protein